MTDMFMQHTIASSVIYQFRTGGYLLRTKGDWDLGRCNVITEVERTKHKGGFVLSAMDSLKTSIAQVFSFTSHLKGELLAAQYPLSQPWRTNLEQTEKKEYYPPSYQHHFQQGFLGGLPHNCQPDATLLRS